MTEETCEQRLQDAIDSLQRIGRPERQNTARVLELFLEVLAHRLQQCTFYQRGLLGLRLRHELRTQVTTVTGLTKHLDLLRQITHELRQAGYEVNLYEGDRTHGPKVVITHQVV